MNPLACPQSDERSITIEFDELHNEIDHIDAEILAAVVRRTELSRRVAAVERACGVTGTPYKRDLAVIHRFGVLGKEGHSLGSLLIRLAHPRNHR
ncbi:chorismate mutase [Rhodococcus sp. 11-3]|uniref:chorismate mutase n=1 Tax=Rhodococcus sp. 11-3 TaxID=2854796 RepID=UPI002040383D|nr:chorismate mutase [Rhodococcus sp. 11-3]USC13286.1 chorismate mutase [Rhodococcus sp. 11-3]